MTYLAELEKSTDDQEIAADLAAPTTDSNSGTETEARGESDNEAIELKFVIKDILKASSSEFRPIVDTGAERSVVGNLHSSLAEQVEQCNERFL